MYKELNIKNFRLFNNDKIFIGKYLTVLAGRNSTGKSTVLGILANSAEIKKKDGVTYSGKRFRAEFGEIFHGSRKFDNSGSDRIEVIIADENGNECDSRKFRTSWQKDGERERFRLIPSKITNDGKKTEAKLNIPVIYLGLSRLFPIGESNEESIITHTLKFRNETDKEWFIKNYNSILSLYDSIIEVDNLSIGETTKKTGVAIETEKYDYLTNSAGQDNLGQILLAILSFRKLKEEYSANPKKKWLGGLLLIDEVDSTLHPAAQKRLADTLIKESKKLGIQVVVSTHSSDFLKHICTKITYNSKDNNEIELYYFTNSNRHLSIKRNIDYSTIEGDLLVQSLIQNQNRIKLYSEDEENRWMLKKLIPQYLSYVDVLDIQIGCNQLINLYICDMSYFGNCIIVLDGDVSDNDIKILPPALRKKLNNIIKLPGNERPEKVIYDYIVGLKSEHPYWEEAEKINMNWIYFKENGPNSSIYSQEKERERYKKWFIDHEGALEATHLFDYWISEHEKIANDFKNTFKEVYNSIAARTFAAKIE